MEAWKAQVYATYADSAVGQRGRATLTHRVVDVRDYTRRYSRYLPHDTTAPALDIGCGTGAFVDTLRSLAYTNVEGIDISRSQIAAATAFGVTGITEASALEYLRARPARYGLITAFSVLEHHTRPELLALLDAIRGALRPGGVLIAVVPNAKGLFGAHVRFADITHECSFTPMSVLQICHVAGLDVTAIVEHGPIAHGPVSAARWIVWQAIRGALLVARIAEGGDWRWPVFTQDLVFVARRRSGAE
jgi:SAM-dependent methyltransferase